MHALRSNVLVGSTPHDLQGVVLGLWALLIKLELPDFGVICIRSQGIWNVVLNPSSRNIAACTLSHLEAGREKIGFSLEKVL